MKEHYWTTEEDSLLKKLAGTMSYKSMSFIIKRTRAAIESRAAYLGIRSPYRNKAHSKDENFWSKQNLLNCYYAGWIAADGFVYRKSFSVGICCHPRDHESLQLFALHIKTTVPIRKMKNTCTNGASCEIERLTMSSSKKWMQDLENNFNITPHKTFRLTPPSFPNDLFACAYLCGYIDGDGSINCSGTQHQISFSSASKEILQWIVDFVIKHFTPENAPHKQITTRGNRNSVSFYGITAIRLFDLLVQVDVPKFQRKWAKEDFLKVVEIYREKNPNLFTPETKLSFDENGNIVRGTKNPLTP